MLCCQQRAILSLSQSGIPTPLGTRDMCRAPAARRWCCWMWFFGAWMHASRPLRPESRMAAETNNHLVPGYGLQFAVVVSLAAGPESNGSETCN